MEHEQLVARVMDEVRPYTMVHPDSLRLTIEVALDAVDCGRAGVIVECGTWMGGASFAMLLAQRYKYGRIIKPVWMFDSFQGLPLTEERDGPAAAAWQQDTGSATYYDNCTAPVERVKAICQTFQFSEDEAVIVPGWFDTTLPAHRTQFKKMRIAALRVDCDWYAPVLTVLTELAPCVVDEGRIVLDDYYAWDGCARAVHDYLSQHDLPWRLRAIGRGDDVGAWIIKRSYRSTHQSS